MFQNIKYLKYFLGKGNNINENMWSYIRKLHNLLKDIKDLDNERVMLCSWKMHCIKKKIYVQISNNSDKQFIVFLFLAKLF